MPLSRPAKRKLLHNRQVHCEGYIRDDGLIEIEAYMVDTKPFDFPNKDRGGFIRAGEALHGISARITFDDTMKIVHAEATLDYTPYDYCKIIAPVFNQLVGVVIGTGWRGRIREVMGGIKGCTHLTELLGPMATTAYQTMVSVKNPNTDHDSTNLGIRQAPRFINTCHSHAKDSPVVKVHWPEVYEEAASNDQ